MVHLWTSYFSFLFLRADLGLPQVWHSLIYFPLSFFHFKEQCKNAGERSESLLLWEVYMSRLFIFSNWSYLTLWETAFTEWNHPLQMYSTQRDLLFQKILYKSHSFSVYKTQTFFHVNTFSNSHFWNTQENLKDNGDCNSTINNNKGSREGEQKQKCN